MLKRTLSLLLMTLIVTMYVPSIVHQEVSKRSANHTRNEEPDPNPE